MQQRARIINRQFPWWLTAYAGWGLGELERAAPVDVLDLARSILGRPRASVVSPSRTVFPRGPPWNAGLTRGVLLGKYGLDGLSLPFFVAEADHAVQPQEEE